MASTFLKSITSTDELPDDGKPHVAIVGRSNVGKSSLVNALTGGKKLAYVSATPGRTQTINLFDVDRRYILVDLPGYGFAKVPKGAKGGLIDLIDDYLANADQLALVLAMIDARHGPTDLDKDMFFHLLESHIPFVVVANKIDKLPKSKALSLLKGIAAEYPHLTVIPCSTTESDGLGAVRSAIDNAIRAR